MTKNRHPNANSIRGGGVKQGRLSRAGRRSRRNRPKDAKALDKRTAQAETAEGHEGHVETVCGGKRQQRNDHVQEEVGEAHWKASSGRRRAKYLFQQRDPAERRRTAEGADEEAESPQTGATAQKMTEMSQAATRRHQKGPLSRGGTIRPATAVGAKFLSSISPRPQGDEGEEGRKVGDRDQVQEMDAPRLK